MAGVCLFSTLPPAPRRLVIVDRIPLCRRRLKPARPNEVRLALTGATGARAG